MFAIIPASRTIDGRDVVVYAPIENESALAPMVRSFLAHVRNVADAYSAGESDVLDMSAWRFPVTGSDGWVRDYSFDGVEIVRSGAYVPRPVNEIRSAWAALAGIGADDETPAEGTNGHLTKGERAIRNRRDNARRQIAKAMGFSGNREWVAAGCPMDASKVKDSWIDNADLPSLPSAQTVTLAGYTDRQHTGRFQGHSHNN